MLLEALTRAAYDLSRRGSPSFRRKVPTEACEIPRGWRALFSNSSMGTLSAGNYANLSKRPATLKRGRPLDDSAAALLAIVVAAVAVCGNWGPGRCSPGMVFRPAEYVEHPDWRSWLIEG